MTSAAVTDPHIETYRVDDPQHGKSRYLHTSPEFAMKRLLATGSGSIYQVCKVFRQGEVGRRHNPEFTLLEWYRLGFDHQQLMTEVDELVRELLAGALTLGNTQRLAYRDAFVQYADVDPHTASINQLQQEIKAQGIDVTGLNHTDKDAWLDVLMTHVIEPALPRDCPLFIYDYPASQAALARIRPEDPPVAERFELYINGMELANGFHELSDAQEQRRRFETDNKVRQAAGLAAMPLDEHFLAALEAGLPDCAGVALGLDRLVMLAAGANSISEVLTFDAEQA